MGIADVSQKAFVQVIVGILLVWLIYWLSTKTMRIDKLVIDVRNNFNIEASIPIFSGFVNSPDLYQRIFNTTNPFTDNYRQLQRSFNRKGGAQFSYSFWMFLDDMTPENVRNKVILLRGDPKLYRYTVRTAPSDDAPAGLTINYPPVQVGVTAPEGSTIKCPLIKFGDTYDSMEVQYNTVDRVSNTMIVDPTTSFFDNTLRKDMLKLIGHKWVLYTFTFEDNVAISDFEDGIVIKFYVNDILYSIHKNKATLRQNNGNLHLFPYGAIQGARFGDLIYHNYALSELVIMAMYQKGPPTFYTTDLRTSVKDTGSPLYLSEYNKLDIYNS